MVSKPLYRRHSRVLQPLMMTAAVFVIGFIAGSMALSNRSDAQGRTALTDTDQAFEPFWDAFSIVESRYVDPVDVETLVNGAIDGMVNALEDEHSGYIRPDLCDRAIDFSGEFSGIGVTIRTIEDTGEIEVVTVIPGSPAEGVGVLPGDIFYQVDGQLVSGMTQAELTALVPGAPGTTVTITFKRGEEFLTFEITREIFAKPNVSYEIISDNIAHVKMLDFNDLSRAQLDEALTEVDINNSNGLIFDIRDNPGGTLASAIEIGSAFIEDGVLLRQVSRDQSEEVTRTRGGYADIDVPIVVLVDETSASASEVIAGAMQDYRVATIMGERTFGKGTVQNIVPELANGGCVRITVKRWLTPNGSWIHAQGITPDIIVEWNPETDEERENDLQLEAAIEFLQPLGA
ncbi:MAG: S41 family peptidase [Chloroflexi bacterium]|nr:S41 family peptidase [Chloroflexota bacterium]